MGTETLRAAVVGVGHLGRHHARLMNEIEGVELAAVVDADPARAAEIAEPLGAVALASVQELPDDVRVASVAVPTSLHHEVTVPLLERGVHVLVEKPMAATLGQAQAMQAAADAKGLVLQVGHIERFNPAMGALAELDLTPRFMEVHRLAPFNYRTLDVSVVMDLMIHDIDIVMELAGSPLKSVDAVGSNVLGKHVDIANARLSFENGSVANVTASRVSFEPLRRTRLFADEGFVSLDFGSRRAFVVRKAPGFDLGTLDAAAMDAVPPKDTFKEFLAQGLMDMQELDMDRPGLNPLLEELRTFVGAVRGEQGGVTAQEGIRAMEVALAIEASIDEHRWT